MNFIKIYDKMSLQLRQFNCLTITLSDWGQFLVTIKYFLLFDYLNQRSPDICKVFALKKLTKIL